MKTNKAKKGLYLGAFVGLIVFTIIGFLPSAYTGGLFGLKLAELFFGNLVKFSIAPRFLVGFFMILGVIISGAIFIIGCAIIGWLISNILEQSKAKELKKKNILGNNL